MTELEKIKAFNTKKDRKQARTTDAVIYTRVSTKEQADNNGSLETQKTYCEEYAKKKGLNVIQYFGGTYESAKSDERKEFNNMLKFVKLKKTVAFIIVYSYDRFSRTGSSGAYISSQLSKQGIKTLSATQQVDTESASGEFQQNLYYIFSQFDNELRRDKTITGMEGKLRQGFYVAGILPCGYTNLHKGEKADKQKIVINADGKILKKAFKWKAEGIMTDIEIAKKITALGLPMTNKKLHKIFKNSFYCGLISHGLLGDDLITGRHEPLITKRMFIEINTVKHPNSRGYKQVVTRDEFPLRRFASCKECSNPLSGYTVKKKSGKEYHFYRCNTQGCRKNHNVDQMHEVFQNVLSELTLSPKYKENAKVLITNLIDQNSKEMRDQEDSLKSKLVGIDKSIEEMEVMLLKKEIKLPLFEKYSEKYEAEKAIILKSLEEMKKQLPNYEKELNSILDFATKLRYTWDSSNTETKMMIQKMIFPEGIVYDHLNRTYLTHLINPFFLGNPLQDLGLDKIKKGNLSNFSTNSLSVRKSFQIELLFVGDLGELILKYS